MVLPDWIKQYKEPHTDIAAATAIIAATTTIIIISARIKYCGCNSQG